MRRCMDCLSQCDNIMSPKTLLTFPTPHVRSSLFIYLCNLRESLIKLTRFLNDWSRKISAPYVYNTFNALSFPFFCIYPLRSFNPCLKYQRILLKSNLGHSSDTCWKSLSKSYLTDWAEYEEPVVHQKYKEWCQISNLPQCSFCLSQCVYDLYSKVSYSLGWNYWHRNPKMSWTTLLVPLESS